jgi:hypothetical protein
MLAFVKVTEKYFKILVTSRFHRLQSSKILEMQNNDNTIAAIGHCKYKFGDIVTISVERDKTIKYKVLSCKDNSIKISKEFIRPSCICTIQRISDNTIMKESEGYLEPFV